MRIRLCVDRGGGRTIRSFGGSIGSSGSTSLNFRESTETKSFHSYEPSQISDHQANKHIGQQRRERRERGGKETYLLGDTVSRLMDFKPFPIIPLRVLKVDEELECVAAYLTWWDCGWSDEASHRVGERARERKGMR
jgi:hypothetical protein